ncbi:WD40-repeat-containing domain protein [Melanogaster broomeanus]|nr:WD40-repeat-containing domain protein [Melanogaster broomeanus]
MTQTTLLQYEAPWPVHAIDWCKSTAPGHQSRPRSAFRLGIASFTEDYRNRIAIVGLQDERVLVEDDYTDYPDFVTLLLATTGDALRVWEYIGDAPPASSAYVGRQPSGGGHRLTLKTALSGQSKVQSQNTGAPLTSFSWNEKAPSLVVTSSIDTTCTVWNIDTATPITQLIAHDREVYDVAWLPGLRAFDLRSLEHSTILYETPAPKGAAPPTQSSRLPTSPLLRIAFNPADSNYMTTFHMDGTDVQILDMRSPGQPVIELRGHRSQVNAMGWSTTERPLLATASDDCQVLLWDLAGHTQTATSPRTANSRLNSPRPDVKKRIITDPIMAYSASNEVTNLAWSPQIPGMTMNTGHSTGPGEWLAIASGKSIKALKV